MHTARHKFCEFFESHLFQKILLLVILLDATLIGLETIKEIEHDFAQEFLILEYIILGLFSLEMVAKITVFRGSFFKSGWNIFDLSIVVISLLPHAAGLTILRAFRVLHSLSLFELSPHTRQLINAIRHVGPSAWNVALFMTVSFYVLAVIGVEFFSEKFPSHFGTLPMSLFTLFRIMIYDDVGVITLPILDEYPYAWVFFVTVILILSFILLNLFVAVVVTALQRAIQEDKSPLAQEVNQESKLISAEAQEIAALKAEIQELKSLILKVKKI